MEITGQSILGDACENMPIDYEEKKQRFHSIKISSRPTEALKKTILL